MAQRVVNHMRDRTSFVGEHILQVGEWPLVEIVETNLSRAEATKAELHHIMQALKSNVSIYNRDIAPSDTEAFCRKCGWVLPHGDFYGKGVTSYGKIESLCKDCKQFNSFVKRRVGGSNKLLAEYFTKANCAKAKITNPKNWHLMCSRPDWPKFLECFYFDGSNKECGLCGEIKPIGDFYKVRKRYTGAVSSHWNSKCKDCVKVANQSQERRDWLKTYNKTPQRRQYAASWARQRAAAERASRKVLAGQGKLC